MKYSLPIFLLLLSTGAQAALNKWVDAEGKIHYSDEAPPSNIKGQKLVTPSAASGVPPQKNYIEREAERKRALKTKEEAEKKSAQQQENEIAKQKNCQGARTNLRTLESNAPISTFNEKGEKTMMDATTRQQNIEEARTEISKNCN